jgi:hypothetical protein
MFTHFHLLTNKMVEVFCFIVVHLYDTLMNKNTLNKNDNSRCQQFISVFLTEQSDVTENTKRIMGKPHVEYQYVACTIYLEILWRHNTQNSPSTLPC